MLLMGAKPVAPADEEDGVLAFAQREAATRAFEAQGVAHLHALEHVGGEASAGHQAHMQLDLAALAGTVGEREGAALAVVQQDVDVLACAEIQRLALGQLQQHAHHVLGQTFHLGHGGGVHFGLLVLGAGEAFHVDDQIALGHGA